MNSEQVTARGDLSSFSTISRASAGKSKMTEGGTETITHMFLTFLGHSPGIPVLGLLSA